MTEEGSYSPPKLAEPESLLGMLQRGRGKGYLQALETPPEQLWPLLFECVTNDPRLDRQLEEREENYASLIIASGMDLEPLAADLRQNDVRDSNCDCCLGLILCTLDCLAETWRHEQAIRILRDYVSYGRKWEGAVRCLGDLDMPGALEGIDEVLVRRIHGDAGVRAQFSDRVRHDWKWYWEFDEDRRTECALFLPVCEPWKTLCRKNIRLAHLFAELEVTRDEVPPPREELTEAEIMGLSLREMFELVDKSNSTLLWRFLPEKITADDEEFLLQHASSGDKLHKKLAFRGLGQLGTPRGFETLKAYIEGAKDRDGGLRRYAYMAVEALPGDLTLETARAWFQSGQNHLHIPGGGILEQHATLDDVPMLIEVLRTPETIRCEDFRLSSALEAFWRFDGIGPIPELEEVFCGVAHCYQRHRAAVAMEITSPIHFRHHYAFECLWDCHDGTRGLACDTVDLTVPGALERLKELATDEDEYDNVREAAQERLEGF